MPTNTDEQLKLPPLPPLPQPFKQLLRRDEVARIFNVDTSTIYKYVENRKLPRPIKIGERSARWRIDDVLRIYDAMCAGAKAPDIEKIVDGINTTRDAFNAANVA